MNLSFRSIAVLFIAAVLLPSACSPATPLATDVPAPVATSTPVPTATKPPPTDTPIPTATATEIPIFWDDFDKEFVPGWSWIRENDALWSLDSEPGFLRIVLTGDRPPRNLLVRDVTSENFQIMTHVRFKPTSNFQFAGLLVYQDDDTMVSLGRAYCNIQNQCVGNGIYFRATQKGQLIGKNFGTDTPAIATAQDASPVAQPSVSEPAARQLPERSRIGLVLAGAGAKGGAHVGVLKVLEEIHVPMDCIAGTSMGALTGAGYAAGIPAGSLEEFLLGVDWPSVVGGVGQRGLQPIEAKCAGVTYSNNFEFGVQDGGPVMPGGIVGTAGIEDLLRRYVARARMQPNFDRLPIPYRAVATDMLTGRMVVLSRGDIATAMRASMAIPGAFSPVGTDKYILSDGGMVRNIPVICR